MIFYCVAPLHNIVMITDVAAAASIFVKYTCEDLVTNWHYW